MEKITSGITGRVVGFAKKVTLELVYDFIDQRTKEIKEEFKEHKIETNQRIEKFETEINQKIEKLEMRIEKFETGMRREFQEFRAETTHRFEKLENSLTQLNMRLDQIFAILIDKRNH
jgi:DNA anti-recombination protein RmuC